MSLKAEKITSVKNPQIKEAVRLKDSSYRKQKSLFIVEGYREILSALNAGMPFLRVFFCPGLFKRSDEARLVEKARLKGAHIFEASPKVYSKIAYGSRQEGLIAVLKKPQGLSLQDLKPAGVSLVVVAEGIEKPGNLGAMLRTADSARVDAFIVAGAKTDIYNPNVVRSSLGAVFSTKIFEAHTQEALSWLKMNKIRIVCADPSSNVVYTSIDFTKPCAVVFGNEEKGLGRVWLDNADFRGRIPMKGIVDSLNVSVAEAVFLFEALRQREP